MNDKMRKRKQRVSCGAVVWRCTSEAVELLLVKQRVHAMSWGIPKGHVKNGETYESCAVREVREETGILVELGERLPDSSVYNRAVHKTVVAYLAKPLTFDEPTCENSCGEIVAAAWRRVNDMPSILDYQRHVVIRAVHAISSKQELSADQAKMCKDLAAYEVDNQHVAKLARVSDAIALVHSYANKLDEWSSIRSELLKNVRPEERVLFKSGGEFERVVAAKWSQLTGRPVLLSP